MRRDGAGGEGRVKLFGALGAGRDVPPGARGVLGRRRRGRRGDPGAEVAPGERVPRQRDGVGAVHPSVPLAPAASSSDGRFKRGGGGFRIGVRRVGPRGRARRRLGGLEAVLHAVQGGRRRRAAEVPTRGLALRTHRPRRRGGGAERVSRWARPRVRAGPLGARMHGDGDARRRREESALRGARDDQLQAGTRLRRENDVVVARVPSNRPVRG
mmetsp:Transcript_201/g.768  ORF Transcript_201/g.768 Transcript_201/m.768 type:complete len:213 (+) Transcript_201:255-893(+)